MQANLLLRHPADARSYGLATAMLEDLGLPEIRLLTNNPDKIRAVEGPNREVAGQGRGLPWFPSRGSTRATASPAPRSTGSRTKVRFILFPDVPVWYSFY